MRRPDGRPAARLSKEIRTVADFHGKASATRDGAKPSYLQQFRPPSGGRGAD
jgi:hypothetical protein